MRLEHIESVAVIHETSWSQHEISVKLGAEYLKLFYSNIVESQHSFGYVFIVDGRVVGYATGFYDYHAFNESMLNRFRLRIASILIKRLFSRKIGWADISNLRNDSRKLRRASYPQHHLGALALSNNYKKTRLGKEAITSTIGAVLRKLEEKGYPGCWGLCDFTNMPMRKYLLKLGFAEIDTIPFIGKSVVLYEKTF